MVFGLSKPNLEKMEKKKDVKGIISKLNDKDSNEREEAARALGRVLGGFGDLRAKKDHGRGLALEPLITTALKDENPNVRKWAINSLARICGDSFVDANNRPDPKSIDLIINCLKIALKDKDKNVRTDVTWAFGIISDVRAVEPLIAALKDENPFVRAGAAKVLDGIPDARAVGPLIATLKDEDRGVRGFAATALGDIGDARAVEPLKIALKDKDEFVRERAATALNINSW